MLLTELPVQRSNSQVGRVDFIGKSQSFIHGHDETRFR